MKNNRRVLAIESNFVRVLINNTELELHSNGTIYASTEMSVELAYRATELDELWSKVREGQISELEFVKEWEA